MLFFVVCACFALFPDKVIFGAQNGLALCVNAVIPSLLPFMFLSLCIIKSNFSRPLGAVISRMISPVCKISSAGCVCLVTGLVGGYGAGARAVFESYKEKQISKKEAERLLAFCNNAGPLFIIGTVGISFFSSKSIGVMLFVVQILTAIICARIFSVNGGEKERIKDEWNFYKKNKPPLGELITKSAVESGSAIINACVFVITFSAVVEILPMGEYSVLSGILEVTRGLSESARMGYDALALCSAFISWGGMSVHFQANALCKGELDMKPYYIGRVFCAVMAYIITKAVCGDINILMMVVLLVAAAVLITICFKVLLFSERPLQCVFRQRRRS